jgi:hypothetical protein
MSLTKFVNSKISKAMAGVDKSEQLQSVIDPKFLFRRNSINLYIARRDSGKTFNVMRELIKLSQLKNKNGQNDFIYCTDKTSDSTVNDLLNLIKLNVREIRYDDMPVFLADLIDAKDAYQDAIENGVLYELWNKIYSDILLGMELNDLPATTPGTDIPYDDAINLFKKPKFRTLLDLLFQNRQPKITYFCACRMGSQFRHRSNGTSTRVQF